MSMFVCVRTDVLVGGNMAGIADGLTRFLMHWRVPSGLKMRAYVVYVHVLYVYIVSEVDTEEIFMHERVY